MRDDKDNNTSNSPVAATATPVPVATARPVRPTVGATPSDMVNATPTVPATTQKTEKQEQP